MLLASLPVFFNVLVLYFFLEILFDIHINSICFKVIGGGMMLAYYLIGSRFILRSKRFVEINESVANSKYKGRLGNIVIVTYLVLTLLSLVVIILYFLHKYGWQ